MICRSPIRCLIAALAMLCVVRPAGAFFGGGGGIKEGADAPMFTGQTIDNQQLNYAQLKGKKVVILGDMEGDYLTTAEYRALVEWVSAGHSLLVLGGYRSQRVERRRSTPASSTTARSARWWGRSPTATATPATPRTAPAARRGASSLRSRRRSMLRRRSGVLDRRELIR